MLYYRFALNYKGLKYRTEWVEFPDIAAVCKQIGASPTRPKEDGITPHYTLPVIQDLSTGAIISGSTNISEYLDRTYSDTPLLFPPGTRSLTEAFHAALRAANGPSLYKLVIVPQVLYLNPRSHDYYRETREATYGKRLEEICPEGEASEANWKQLEAGLAKISGWLKAAGDKPFFGGDAPIHADFILVAALTWARKVWGEASKDWQRVKELDEGWWARYLQSFEKYTMVI